MRLIDAEPIEKYIENGLNEKDPEKRFGHDAIEIMTEIHYAPTIAPPPNDPLTLEELKEMDGEPVYCIFNMERFKLGWAIVLVDENEHTLEKEVKFTTNFATFCSREYGKKHGLTAYRHKPEEEST